MYILLFANTANAHNPMGVEAVSNYFGYSYIPGAILFILALVCSRILIKRRLRMKEMAIIFFAVFTSGYITLFFASGVLFFASQEYYLYEGMYVLCFVAQAVGAIAGATIVNKVYIKGGNKA